MDGIKLFEHFNKLGERKSVYAGRATYKEILLVKLLILVVTYIISFSAV